MNNMTREIALPLFGAIVLAVSTAGSSQAQYVAPGDNWRMGPGMTMGWGGGPQARWQGRFSIIDLNDDGRVSDEEAASAAEDVFLAMDADDDGQLTKEEYLAVRMGPGAGWNPERQAAMQARKEARYAEFDADGDGIVTKGEFLDTAKAHHAAADADGDGVVTPWEHRRQSWF